MNTLITILISILASVTSVFGLNHAQIKPLLGSTLPIAGTTYNLSGSGVSSSATSITLQSLTIPQTGQIIQDADLSDTFYVTLDPGNRTKQEIVSCTTVVNNSNGTATLSGCSRGLAPISPYTASSTLQFVHSGGAQVIFSDPPQLFNLYPAKANTETITGLYTFAGGLLSQASSTFSSGLTISNGLASTFSGTTTFTVGALVGTNNKCGGSSSSLQLCDKGYIDGVAVAGASNASLTVKGIVEEATAAEIEAGTQSGGTGAELFINPSILNSSGNIKRLNYYAATTTTTSSGAMGFISTTTAITSTQKLIIWASCIGSGTTNYNLYVKPVGSATSSSIARANITTGTNEVSFLLNGIYTAVGTSNIDIYIGDGSKNYIGCQSPSIVYLRLDN